MAAWGPLGQIGVGALETPTPHLKLLNYLGSPLQGHFQLKILLPHLELLTLNPFKPDHSQMKCSSLQS